MREETLAKCEKAEALISAGAGVGEALKKSGVGGSTWHSYKHRSKPKKKTKAVAHRREVVPETIMIPHQESGKPVIALIGDAEAIGSALRAAGLGSRL